MTFLLIAYAKGNYIPDTDDKRPTTLDKRRIAAPAFQLGIFPLLRVTL